MHEKMTFSPLKVTFRIVKTTFSGGRVTKTNFFSSDCYI